MPANAPNSAPSAPAANNDGIPPIDPPILKAISWVQKALDRVGGGLVSAGRATEGFLDNKLRFSNDPPSAEYEGFFKTPFAAAGHVIDGTAGNIARRAKELVTPDFHQLAAEARLTAGNILHPVRMVQEPVERVVKPVGRIVTSIGQRIRAAIMAIPRTLDEFVSRGVRNSVNQVMHQVDRVPLLGQAIAAVSNFTANTASKITNGVRNGLEWVFEPFDQAHQSVAPAA